MSRCSGRNSARITIHQELTAALSAKLRKLHQQSRVGDPARGAHYNSIQQYALELLEAAILEREQDSGSRQSGMAEGGRAATA